MKRLSSLALAVALTFGGVCTPAVAQEAAPVQSAESSQTPPQNQGNESSLDDNQIPIIIGVLAGTAGFVVLADIIMNFVNSGQYHTLIPKDFKLF